MSEFTKTLVVSPLADGRTWVLRESFRYDVGAEGSGNAVNVPERFITDFASVPRPLWWILPPWGKYGNAAVIHDYGYWSHERTRSETDRIFLEGMQVLGVAGFTRHAMYLAVRLFGSWAWNSRKKQLAARPGKHIAKKQPVKASETRQDLLS